MAELVQASLSSELVPVISGLKTKIVLQEQSQPYSVECEIEAKNDLQAVGCWLNKHAKNPKTLDAYRREAQRLLMWCVYERGLSLGKLKAQDLEGYIQFLQAPPQSWCTTRASLRAGKQSAIWRPFVAGLKGTALKMAVRIIHSLLNYLVNAQYLKSNALKLVNDLDKSKVTQAERQYQVWERMLEADEWIAVQQALEALPEQRDSEIELKLRTQLLFALLYFLGLRIHEVVTHGWNAFRLKEGQWWFFVKGKGEQYAHIPVNDKLLSFVKIYRIYLGREPLPSPEDNEPLFMNELTRKSFTIRQLYNLVKVVGREASKQFIESPLKQKKLQRLSPHWLRHLFASHQDKAGIAATIIKANMRHSSHQITQLYLHAEDKLRHQAVQKIDLNIIPKWIQRQTVQKSDMLVQIDLSEGPSDRLLGLKRLIEAIEQNVLQNYRWQWQGIEKSEFFAKLEREILFFKNIRLCYQIESLTEEKMQAVKTNINLESKTRLFVCRVEIATVR